MLRHDRTLSDPVLRYERARRDRKILQVAISGILFIVTLLVSTFGAHRVISAYSLVATLLLMNETLRRGIRGIGTAQNAHEAVELARSVPFYALMTYGVAWIASSELLVGTGALSAPFGNVISIPVSVMLVLLALYVTWQRDDTELADAAATIMWLSLLVPTMSSSPRTASTIVSVLRVLIAISTHAILESRSDGRIEPSKWNDDNSTSLMNIANVVENTSNMSARRLTQVAWIFKVWPPLVFVSAGIIVLNEMVFMRPSRTVDVEIGRSDTKIQPTVVVSDEITAVQRTRHQQDTLSSNDVVIIDNDNDNEIINRLKEMGAGEI